MNCVILESQTRNALVMAVIYQKKVNWVIKVQRVSHMNVGRMKVTFEVCVGLHKKYFLCFSKIG